MKTWRMKVPSTHTGVVCEQLMHTVKGACMLQFLCTGENAAAPRQHVNLGRTTLRPILSAMHCGRNTEFT